LPAPATPSWYGSPVSPSSPSTASWYGSPVSPIPSGGPIANGPGPLQSPAFPTLPPGLGGGGQLAFGPSNWSNSMPWLGLGGMRT
jgi:hypothetical protein